MNILSFITLYPQLCRYLIPNHSVWGKNIAINLENRSQQLTSRIRDFMLQKWLALRDMNLQKKSSGGWANHTRWTFTPMGVIEELLLLPTGAWHGKGTTGVCCGDGITND